MEYSTLDTSEEWKDYPEFPDSYQVSSFGRVRGKDKKIIKKNGVLCTRKGKLLSQSWHKTGCYRVRLCVDGSKCSRSVHRMVGETFIEKHSVDLEINHKDGNRGNNNVSNLEWVSRKENIRHAYENGLNENKFGKEARHFKRAVLVFKNGEHVATLRGNKEIEEFGLCYKIVSACLLGKQNTHKGYTFKSKPEERYES